MGDDGERLQRELVDELRDVADIVRHRIDAALDPFGIAMSAQVGGDDVPVVAQPLRHPVPVAAMIAPAVNQQQRRLVRSEEHTSELQSLMRISYAVFCLKKKKTTTRNHPNH